MACQLQLNVFCTFDMKDIKFTGIYMTSSQRGQNAFMQVLLVAGGSKRVGRNVLPAYKYWCGSEYFTFGCAG